MLMVEIDARVDVELEFDGAQIGRKRIVAPDAKERSELLQRQNNPELFDTEGLTHFRTFEIGDFAEENESVMEMDTTTSEAKEEEPAEPWTEGKWSALQQKSQHFTARYFVRMVLGEAARLQTVIMEKREREQFVAVFVQLADDIFADIRQVFGSVSIRMSWDTSEEAMQGEFHFYKDSTCGESSFKLAKSTASGGLTKEDLEQLEYIQHRLSMQRKQTEKSKTITTRRLLRAIAEDVVGRLTCVLQRTLFAAMSTEYKLMQNLEARVPVVILV